MKPNLTPKQQEASRALEVKLKEKREADPAKNWIIKKYPLKKEINIALITDEKTLKQALVSVKKSVINQ